MLSKNTCEGIHLIVKLPAIRLQACKFTKTNFLTHIFQGFLLDFKLFFIVLFLGIISWKGASLFSGGGGEGGFVFQMGGFIFNWGCAPWGASFLMRRVFEKNRRMRPCHPMPPTHQHYGKPWGRGIFLGGGQ